MFGWQKIPGYTLFQQALADTSNRCCSHIRALHWTTCNCEPQPKLFNTEKHSTSPVCLATLPQIYATFLSHRRDVYKSTLASIKTSYQNKPLHMNNPKTGSFEMKGWVCPAPLLLCFHKRQIKTQVFREIDIPIVNIWQRAGGHILTVHCSSDLVSPFLLPFWTGPRGAKGRPCFCQPASQKHCTTVNVSCCNVSVNRTLSAWWVSKYQTYEQTVVVSKKLTFSLYHSGAETCWRYRTRLRAE